MQPERIWILMARRKAGEATPEEMDELERLLAEDPAPGYPREVVDKLWDAPLRTLPDSQMPEKLWNRISSRVSRGKPALLSIGLWKYVAAASVVSVIATAAFWLYRPAAGSKLLAGTEVNEVSTQAQSKSKLQLPDGSIVWLNGNSRLTYANGGFGNDNREVVLTGEAFFDITRNERLPFIIHAGPVNITVKGTAFNVKAYPKQSTVETALVRGLVEISTNSDPERKILLKPNEKIIIPTNPHPSLASVADHDTAQSSPFTITRMQTTGNEPAEIAWLKTQLVFDNEPLSSLAPKLESWYNIRVYFTDRRLKEKRFSGVIEKETLKQTLEAMQFSSHFNYRLTETELWIGTKE